MNTDYSDLNELDRQRIEQLVEQGTSHDDAVAQVRAEKAPKLTTDEHVVQIPVGGGDAGTDPRDARIAELEAEVESLKAALPGVPVSAKPLSVEERTAELVGQGLTEEDAAEQAAYEARTTADNSPPPVQTTV